MELFDIIAWTALILFIIWALYRTQEHFSISIPESIGETKLPSAIAGLEIFGFGSHSLRVGGLELFSRTPFTCPLERPDLQDGLCYEKCRDGYHGKGPVCWANSENRGIGSPVGLEPCPSGWVNDGLICREPIRWDGCCSRGLFNECWGCARGGTLRGRLNGGGQCPNIDPGGPREKTERVDGLCYKKCPAHLPNAIPGMPYLCYKGGDLSHTRGVGRFPPVFRLLGKYTFGQL